MKSYLLTHLADQAVACELAASDDQHRTSLADLLARLAEFDARRLYLPAAFPSMFSYCVHHLHWCEQAAFKRIRAARTARGFPAIFPALAAGRLHLSAVVLLAPYLTPGNAADLLAAATHKSKAEIEQLLAERFPRPEVPALVQAVTALSAASAPQLSPGTVGTLAPERVGSRSEQLSPGTVGGRREALDRRPRVAPLAPRRFALQLTMSQELHDKLRYAQELLSHQVPAGDVAQVLERAMDALISQLEKRKFAAARKPRHCQRSTTDGRYVPAHVKRSIWKRDGGQCTFVSETGCRCPARAPLEFDHIDEVAFGGQATVGRMRLRCRAHNQYGAEQTFGVEFMRRKREGARRNAAAAHAQVAAREKAAEVIPWLRALGFRAEEARRAAALCEAIPEASLEHRIRTALGSLAPRASSLGRVAPG